MKDGERWWLIENYGKRGLLIENYGKRVARQLPDPHPCTAENKEEEHLPKPTKSIL